MTTEPLERLAKHDYTRVWDRFYEAFDFRPSMHEFPAIAEPADSITWSLDAIDDGNRDANIDRLSALVQDALNVCTPPDGALLILDWQHPGYRLRPHLPPTEMFLPHAMEADLRPGWPLGPYPDGDYFILISEDFNYGTFGHPWEHTLCMIGADLLNIAADEITDLLQHIVRRGGQPVTSS